MCLALGSLAPGLAVPVWLCAAQVAPAPSQPKRSTAITDPVGKAGYCFPWCNQFADLVQQEKKKLKMTDFLYPRPQLVRKHWQSLNGAWKFSFDPDKHYNFPLDANE